METCAEWGIDVFVHYSFPRHLAMETIAARKANLEANCEALGIQYVERTAPDPDGRCRHRWRAAVHPGGCPGRDGGVCG